jgi:hypothetical protein
MSTVAPPSHPARGPAQFYVDLALLTSYEKVPLAVIVTFASCLGGTVLGIGILARTFDTVEEGDDTIVGAAWPCLDCLEALLCNRNPRFMTGDEG